MTRKNLSLVASVGLVTLLCGASPASAQTAPPLGAVASFGVLGGSAVSAAGPAGTVIDGDVGSNPTPSVSGFPPAVVTAGFTVYTAANVATANARAAASTAYLNLAAQGCTVNVPADLSLLPQPLVPGVYCMGAGTLTGTITLTGSASDVWVFKTASSLTTAGASQVVMGGAASACNVYWQVSSSAALGAASTFRGSIFSGVSIGLGTTANVTGRAVAGSGDVTMAGTNTIGGCSAALAVLPPTVTKAFSPSSNGPGGISTLTITLTNANATAATLTAPLVDSLPAGVVIAASPNASTTCGGVVTATAGGSSVTLSQAGSTIPAGGSCTVIANVTSATPGTYTNTIAANALQTSNGSNTVAATAVLIIAAVVPTLSEWAMIMLVALLCLGGFFAIRQRRMTD